MARLLFDAAASAMHVSTSSVNSNAASPEARRSVVEGAINVHGRRLEIISAMLKVSETTSLENYRAIVENRSESCCRDASLSLEKAHNVEGMWILRSRWICEN